MKLKIVLLGCIVCVQLSSIRAADFDKDPFLPDITKAKPAVVHTTKVADDICKMLSHIVSQEEKDKLTAEWVNSVGVYQAPQRQVPIRLPQVLSHRDKDVKDEDQSNHVSHNVQTPKLTPGRKTLYKQ